MTIPDLTLCELADTGIRGLESYSPFCLKVHRALKTLGLHYRREHGRTPASFASYNPLKQVPVLLMNGEAIADSTRILERLERIGAGSLVPADATLRGESYLWEEMGDGVLAGFVAAARFADPDNWPRVRRLFFNGMPAPLRRVIPAVVRRRVIKGLIAKDVWRAGRQACWLRFQTTLNALDARAPHSGNWLGGERITTADLGIFAPLQVLRNELTPWQAEQIERRPRLAAYLDRVQSQTFIADTTLKQTRLMAV